MTCARVGRRLLYDCGLDIFPGWNRPLPSYTTSSTTTSTTATTILVFDSLIPSPLSAADLICIEFSNRTGTDDTSCLSISPGPFASWLVSLFFFTLIIFYALLSSLCLQVHKVNFPSRLWLYAHHSRPPQWS